MHKHVVLISPHSAMIDCVNLNNIKCTIVDKPENKSNYSDERYHSLLLFDYLKTNNLYNILEGVHKATPIDAIITLTEKALPLVTKASEYLGLKCTPSEVIELIHDKSKMRTFLSSFDDYSIPFSQPSTPEDLIKFSENYGFPFIVKPQSGVGSQGVHKINKASDLSLIKSYSDLIAEQYILGDEYSVECFSFNGKSELISITEKKLLGGENSVNFTEVGHCIPAAISDRKRKHIESYVSKFLDIIGLKDGPSHTEIKVENDTIRIIETHNRIGGDRISSLVKLSTGIDLVELSILWPLNMCKPIEETVSNQRAASIRFFNPKVGKLTSIDGYNTVKHSPDVVEIELHCQEGDTIKPIANSFNRYGFVIATGNNANQASENAEKATSRIRFNYAHLT